MIGRIQTDVHRPLFNRLAEGNNNEPRPPPLDIAYSSINKPAKQTAVRGKRLVTAKSRKLHHTKRRLVHGRPARLARRRRQREAGPASGPDRRAVHLGLNALFMRARAVAAALSARCSSLRGADPDPLVLRI